MSKKEELKEILKNNPDAKAKLVGYFKYYFDFECEGVNFSLGGDSDDIYRLNLNELNPLRDLIGWIND